MFFIMNICSIRLNMVFMKILKQLIDSESKARLLPNLLDSQHSFSVSELGRLSGLSKASVSSIVSQWEKTGLVLSEWQGRNKLIHINPNFYLLPELKGIFEKTRDFQKPLIDRLKAMQILKSRSVKAIVIFGSRTRKDFSHASDLDVMIGLEDKNSPITEKIAEEFVKAGSETGITFSHVFLDKKGIKARWKEKDEFIRNILIKGKILKGGKWLGYLQTASRPGK